MVSLNRHRTAAIEPVSLYLRRPAIMVLYPDRRATTVTVSESAPSVSSGSSHFYRLISIRANVPSFTRLVPRLSPLFVACLAQAMWCGAGFNPAESPREPRTCILVQRTIHPYSTVRTAVNPKFYITSILITLSFRLRKGLNM